MLSRMHQLLSWAEIVGGDSAEAGQPARRALVGGHARRGSLDLNKLKDAISAARF